MPRSRFPQRALVHQLGDLTAMRSRPIASGVSLGLAALAIVGTGRCGADGGPRPSLDGQGRRDGGICPLGRVELMLGRRLIPGPRSDGCRMTRTGQRAVCREPERQQECRQDPHRQRLRLVRPVPPARCGRCARHDGCGRGVAEDVGECQRLRYLAGGVELPDQRLRGGPGRLGYGADVAPRVKVAAACGIVVVLDVADECFPDAGPLADLGNSKASLVACLCQCLADTHAAPPHMCIAPRAARITGCRWCGHHRQVPTCYTGAFCHPASQTQADGVRQYGRSQPRLWISRSPHP